MSEDIDLKTLEQLIQVIPLDAVPDAAQQILAGKIRGRFVVDMSL